VYEAKPVEALTTLLASLEEQSQQSVAQDSPGVWAKQAVKRVHDLLGAELHVGSELETEWRKSRLTKALAAATQKVAEHWAQQLAQTAWGLMEFPGKRLAAAEAVLKKFWQFCGEMAGKQQARLDQQRQTTALACEDLDQTLKHCVHGSSGFSFFGGKS